MIITKKLKRNNNRLKGRDKMIRRFKDEDALEVSNLIEHTLRTVNIKDYSEEYIEHTITTLTPDKLIDKSK